MGLKFFDTMSREKVELKTIKPGIVTLYACGLTVYSDPHIGNWRAYINWDILVRTLLENGYDVEHVQNITDVGHLTDDEDSGDDKLQVAANKERKTAWDIAEYYAERADKGREELGIIKPKYSPKATDYIEQQIALVRKLENLEMTYSIKDDGIYFDTSKLDDYGKLARLDVEGLRSGARIANTDKKNPTDFALWKFSPKDAKRDMEWDSPWGLGFPGWHVECSVMAVELLGEQIDIHVGGVDHIPVHHTNEIAQTEPITGMPFANIWMHSAHMMVNGSKMSKSLGNVFTLDDLQKKGYELQAFRLLILTSHYRTENNFTWKLMNAAQSRLKRWQSVADLRWQLDDNAPSLKKTFASSLKSANEAFNDDLDTPKVLSSLEEVFNTLEKQLLSSNDDKAFDKFMDYIKARLGIDLYKDDISKEQKSLISKREKARAEKDYQSSDTLRDSLLETGIVVRDTENGAIWSRS